MRVVVQDTLRNRQWTAHDGSGGFRIGRDADCKVRLQSQFVSRVHAEVEQSAAGWAIALMPSASQIEVDGLILGPSQSRILGATSEVRIAEFVVIIETAPTMGPLADASIEQVNLLQQDLHASLLRSMDLRIATREGDTATSHTLEQVNAIIDDLLHGEYRARVWEDAQMRQQLLTLGFQVRLENLISQVEAKTPLRKRLQIGSTNAPLEAEVRKHVEDLSRHLQLELSAQSGSEDLKKVLAGLKGAMAVLIAKATENVQFYAVSQLLKKLLGDMVFGLGPLQDLLDLPDITEIMVVEPSLVYLERDGRMFRSNRTFVSAEALMSVIERIVSPLGRRIDNSQPLVDARLPDGSRVNAIIPPLALRGPCLTIRRFPSRQLVAKDLIRMGSMTAAADALMDACVRYRANIIVAGGTGSGKTTLLNILSAMIPSHERIVTIEDSAELQMQQEHVVSLETRPPNAEGTGAYTIRDLVRNALRMRPDRIVVGECRGGEALDMLQAMNTGHDGSMTTVHANSAQDVVSRLETMVLTNLEIPLAAVRRQISQAIDMVVYLQRTGEGRRMVTQVSEVVGLHPKTGTVELRDVMAATPVNGKLKLKATGYIPTFIGRIVEMGLLDLDRWFGRAGE